VSVPVKRAPKVRLTGRRVVLLEETRPGRPDYGLPSLELPTGRGQRPVAARPARTETIAPAVLA
jgi:hypothetical protein